MWSSLFLSNLSNSIRLGENPKDTRTLINNKSILHRFFIVTNEDALIKLFRTYCPPSVTLHTFETLLDSVNNIHYRPSAIFIDAAIKTNSFKAAIQKIAAFDINIPLIYCYSNEIEDPIFIEKHFFDLLPMSETSSTHLNLLFKKIENQLHAQYQVEELKAKMHHGLTQDLVCSCPPMQQTATLIEKAAQTNITAYITGETGSGKGLAAYIIHQLSSRQNFPYQSINLSTIPEEELEEQLFGSIENGTISKGVFELVNEGSLYLSEIGALNLALQAKLLKVLQTNTFNRVGEKTQLPFNARLIVSTQMNLLEKIKDGEFREDLYYRIMGLPICIPPLRKRGNDILLLTIKFLEQFTTKNNLASKEFSKEAKKKLLSYTFPGNVRELRSIVERAVLISNNNIITEEDIEFHGGAPIPDFLNKEMTFEEYKSTIIHYFLEKYENDIFLVSNKLDIGKSTIYRMLKSEKEKEKKSYSWFGLF